MARGKRKVPDINSSSTADIAFLLLIFFLITTSMDTDRGLARLLPPPPEDEKNENTDKIKERNILQVYLNKDDALMCGNDYIGVDQLRQKAKEFIANINNAENMPEKTQKNVDFFGTTLVNDKHVISLQNDRGSSYQAYISVQNELVAAYNELRDELAQEKFGVTYAELNDAQQKAVRESSSTADIAFLLLIFFLITTSMDTDRGLARLLPPPPEDEKNENTDKIKERNILQVYLNKDDALMCGNDYIGVDQLRQKAKEFIANINNAENMPEKTQKNVDFFGTTLVNDKHVISLQNDRGSSYQAYISVQNELVAAYNELRDELAQEKFGVTYAELNDAQQKAVREVYPQRISEAEPKKYGEKKK